MKVSIVTVCLNSSKTISDTINSVNSQTYKNIEHIFVDGGSNDNTLSQLKNNPNKNKKIIIAKKSGIYEAMNIGIKKSTGDIIHILNSDDVFSSNKIVEKVISDIKKNYKYDFFCGHVSFFGKNNFFNVKRFYQANQNLNSGFEYGVIPPHPGSFVKSKIYKKVGLYNNNFKIAGDFDFFLRSVKLKKCKYRIINSEIVRMRTGGRSTTNIFNYLFITREIIKSMKLNNIKVNYFKIYFRFILKLKEIFFLDIKKINSNFKMFNITFNHKFYEKKMFNIYKNPKKINFNKNIVLSAMNLAFLGYYQNKKVFPYKNLFHWPDGIFLKKIVNVKKIPGRKILNEIKINKKIKHIRVIGNLHEISKKFLEKKYKRKLIHQPLPFITANKINKLKIKSKASELIFITLPTPKQEILARNISINNKYFRVICIGGSINMASGIEKIVPDYLDNFEYIWRLQNDPVRRLTRLFQSYFYYLLGKKKELYNNTIFNLID